ncbi:CHAT domain-containing protein [Nocardioides aestuarii]|uniref:CHAT domain-containing protein n=1 Tax=Nocardioides aestuarii TaxID=252231 RepID=A0ABW4TIJ0_9ACTN
MLDAEELSRRGRAASTAGRHAEAVSLLTRAVERAADDRQRATALQSLAHATAERGSPDDGIALCREALKLKGLDATVLGTVHSQLGLLLMRRGEVEAALAEMATALPLVADQPDLRGRLHLNRGNIHLQRRDADRAAADFEDARTRTQDAVDRAMATHNLGYVELMRGELVGALRLMDEAAPVLAPLSPVSEAVVEVDRAEVMIAAGMPRAAADALDRAVRTYASRRLRQFQGEALVVRARALLLVDPNAARADARRAARVFEARGSTTWALRAEALALCADVRRHVGRPLRATSWWERTLVAGKDLADRLAAREMPERTEVLLHLALASEQVTGAVPVPAPRAPRRGEEPVGVRLLRQEVRARAAWRAGRRAASFGLVRDGLADLHAWQSSYGSLDLQSSLVGHGQALARVGLRQAVADGRPDVVHEWSERARALVARVPPVRLPADPDAAARIAALRTLPADATDDAARLRDRVREDSWYRPGAGTVLEPLPLDRVREALGDATLVSYLLADRVLHALVVGPDRVVLRRVGPVAAVDAALPGLAADLDLAATTGLPDALAAGVRAGLTARLAALQEHLLRPVAGDLGEGRLVVVPCGRLAAVPWSMLPALVGRPVTVARSASMWAAAAPPDAVARVGLVAGPGVPRAEEEATACAAAWVGRARVLGGPTATAAAVSSLTSDVDLLHVAAHGHHADEQPLFSGLELVDGPWFGYDVELLPRLPSLVVLSACELGRSTVRASEELVGMTAAWLHAGVRCVVASQAALSDDLAATVLPGLHAGLAAGRAPADVLADLAPADGLPLTCFGAGW